jgi:membrane-associated protease RseP (regulator of RpoE activity)
MSESLREISPFAPVLIRPKALQPTAREWTRHSILFLITVVTTSIGGIAITAPGVEVLPPARATLLQYILYLPQYYSRLVLALVSFAIANPRLLADGLLFSGSLLTILTAHEMGHYIACRLYGVTATLPFFIPGPPLLSAGTFGAFIRIRSPIPSRRALFDIGLAGPLAGFVIAVPIAVMGIASLQPGPPIVGHAMIFNDPLLFRLMARALAVPLRADSLPNSYYLAAWIGLLVTSLNLMPVGQLDGGHGTFALFGRSAHKWIGRTAFFVTAGIAVLGWFWHGSPSGLLYALILGIMLRFPHPQPQTMDPLGTARTLIALLTLIVFLLSFWPFPITIT